MRMARQISRTLGARRSRLSDDAERAAVLREAFEGVAAGLLPARSELERVLDPVLTQAREIARLNDPRGLYAYCWCTQPGVTLRAPPSPR